MDASADARFIVARGARGRPSRAARGLLGGRLVTAAGVAEIPATRPVLALWQRVALWVMPWRWLKSQRWVRAYAGGRWAVRPSEGVWYAVRVCPGTVDGFLVAVGYIDARSVREHRARCTCEVYPYALRLREREELDHAG